MAPGDMTKPRVTNTESDIQSRRVAAGLTQEQLAEQLGVERKTIARWESGEVKPRKAMLLALDVILGVKE